MNDNFNTKTAIADALVAEAGLTTDTATRVVDFMTAEGIIDFPVATELYEQEPFGLNVEGIRE